VNVKPLLIFGVVLKVALCNSLHAQSYSLDWFKVSGGGGTSAGGAYRVSGTIGQLDAGAMRGGSYLVSGGFWGLIATVQTAGAPPLSIQITTTNTVVLSWPVSPFGFVLQKSSAVSTTAWLSFSTAPLVVGGHNEVLIAPVFGDQYFRLKSQ